MSRSTAHPLQPRTDHDGTSRRLSVLACKRAIRNVLEPRLRAEWQELGIQISSSASGDWPELPSLIEEQDSYLNWSCMNRASQDRMWSLLSEQIDSDYPRIARKAQESTRKVEGSLELDASVKTPDYQGRAPIHGQPGGYMLDRGDSDLSAGILYEAGGNIYAMGQGIGKSDSKGERLIEHVRERYPDFQPQRILEMGCSAGGQSTDYPLAFPDAVFHAIDLSPSMLRFAHARASVLGSAVHFHQADAAATPFPDGYFDLVISHNMFHEVAADHMPAIMQECHRLLSPGGVCIHQDVPIQTGRLDPFMQFVSAWQKDHNDEPFWLDFANADLPRMMATAGFDKATVRADYIQAIDGPIPWYVVCAVR